ncbi:hypothetical protein ACET3X_005950 [Alternaria dauci]|uniref:Uncharacterized protein n=1 Tax=Alternaria dauci TaxID=48095 RepID=A0ABR3UJM0_9PLEO
MVNLLNTDDFTTINVDDWTAVLQQPAGVIEAWSTAIRNVVFADISVELSALIAPETAQTQLPPAVITNNVEATDCIESVRRVERQLVASHDARIKSAKSGCSQNATCGTCITAAGLTGFGAIATCAGVDFAAIEASIDIDVAAAGAKVHIDVSLAISELLACSSKVNATVEAAIGGGNEQLRFSYCTCIPRNPERLGNNTHQSRYISQSLVYTFHAMSPRPSLMPPTQGSFLSSGAFTPSGLTPNTRSEAEAAFTSNSASQTDSAAPDPRLLPLMGAGGGNETTTENEPTEAVRAYTGYRRPGVARASSSNYENALKRAQQASASSDFSANSEAPASLTAGQTVASPSGTTPFPPPGQGVVPLNYGSTPVGAGQGDSIKKTRSRGLSLSGLAQQQGWSEQDYKRVYSAELLAEEPKNNAGYGTGPK